MPTLSKGTFFPHCVCRVSEHFKVNQTFNKALLKCLLNTGKYEATITFLWSLLQCLTILTVMKFFFMSSLNTVFTLSSSELHPVFHTNTKYSGRITFSDQLATPCLMHPKLLFALLAARAHCWLMLSLLLTSTPRSLSAELLSHRLSPSLCLCPALLHPNCSTCPCWISCHIWSLYPSVSLCKVSQPIPQKVNSTFQFSICQQICLGRIPLLHPDHWQKKKYWIKLALELSTEEMLLVRLATSQR